MNRTAILLLVLTAGLNQAFAHQGLEKSIQQFSHLIEQNTEPMLYLLRADALRRHKMYHAAKADLDMAEHLSSKTAVAFHRGLLSYDKGKFSEALEFFKLYQKFYPKHSPSLLFKARTLNHLGEYSAALDAYVRYLGNSEQVHLGDIVSSIELAAERLGQFDTALEIINQAYKRVGFQQQLVDLEVDLLASSNQHEQALGRLNAMLLDQENSVHWLERRAVLNTKTCRFEAATRDFNQAISTLSKMKPTTANRERLTHLRQQLEKIHIHHPSRIALLNNVDPFIRCSTLGDVDKINEDL